MRTSAFGTRLAPYIFSKLIVTKLAPVALDSLHFFFNYLAFLTLFNVGLCVDFSPPIGTVYWSRLSYINVKINDVNENMMVHVNYRERKVLSAYAYRKLSIFLGQRSRTPDFVMFSL